MPVTFNGKVYDYPQWADDNGNGELPKGSVLAYSDSRGQFIPAAFCEDYKDNEAIIIVGHEPDWKTLEGPNQDWYWDEWNIVQNSTYLYAKLSGILYTIHQDGDCWFIPMVERVEEKAE